MSRTDDSLRLIQTRIVNPPTVPISNALEGRGVIYTVQMPRDPETLAASGDGGIEVQAERVFEQLRHVLECAGSTMNDVAQITIYLVDRNDAPGMNAVYRRYFTEAPYPNRATVIVKELLGENCRIEIVVQALAPSGRA